LQPNAYQQYQQSYVLDADPVELISMLYRAAADAVAKAREHLMAGDIFARGRQISRAQEIISELSQALKMEHGEVAANLARLYDYMQHRLHEAHAGPSVDAMDEVERLLVRLHDAWSQIVPHQGQAAAPADRETRVSLAC
jgi:flagellar protein FliS